MIVSYAQCLFASEIEIGDQAIGLPNIVILRIRVGTDRWREREDQEEARPYTSSTGKACFAAHVNALTSPYLDRCTRIF